MALTVEQKTARKITSASFLLWTWGVFVLLGGFAIGYPAYATQGTALPLILFLVWGIAVCLSAFALRKGRWGVRWWGAALCTLAILGLLVSGLKIALFGIALNAAALWSVISCWRSITPAASALTTTSTPDAPTGGAPG